VTEKEAVTAFLAGQRVSIGTYFSGSSETVNYRDKKTQQAMSFVTVKHTCIIGGEPCVVQERVPEGFKPEQFVQSIKQGAKVFVTFTALVPRSGIAIYSGVVQNLV